MRRCIVGDGAFSDSPVFIHGGRHEIITIGSCSV